MLTVSSDVKILAGAVLLLAAVRGTVLGAEGDLPLFDAHIHYSENTWDALSPAQAVAKLRAAGIVRALVSSSSDEGTQRLYDRAPDLVIPALRPYRDMAHQWDWVRDEGVVPYLEHRIRTYRYGAIGEFHVDGPDADLPNIRAIIKLARQYGLFLYAHSDADAVERMFRHDPEITILWAHGGFEPPDIIDRMMRRYPRLWSELSLRGVELAETGGLGPAWRDLLIRHADRMLIGSDTYVPEQWLVLEDDARATRTWLRELPLAVARQIAYENGEKLITQPFRRAVVRP